MLSVLHSLGIFIIDLFKSRRRLEAENLFLRHQLSIALRRAPPRLRLRGRDRVLLVWMIRRELVDEAREMLAEPGEQILPSHPGLL
jgi:hypothetical protein